MPNIMMTDVCNLHCPYCFANEFVNKDKNEITEEAFDKAVDFIVGDGSHSSVGMIGGEPTVHSKFEYFMRKLINDPRVKNIILYTNGILLDRFWDVCCHSKVHLLINCNPPEDIGENNFRKLTKNLDTMINQKMCQDRVILGINMYGANFRYKYILDLLKKYHYHQVRVSITVPNMDENRNIDAHDYFRLMKPRLFEFFHELLAEDIIPHFDCNKIPYCLISDAELAQFQKYLAHPYIRENINKSNISNREVRCAPVIDIRQDLTAVRCFGLSGCTKQKIEDFKGIRDLENYYRCTVDSYIYSTVYSHKCVDCYERKTLQCSGGCLAFKINAICNMMSFAQGQMELCESGKG